MLIDIFPLCGVSGALVCPGNGGRRQSGNVLLVDIVALVCPLRVWSGNVAWCLVWLCCPCVPSTGCGVAMWHGAGVALLPVMPLSQRQRGMQPQFQQLVNHIFFCFAIPICPFFCFSHQLRFLSQPI